MHDYSRREVIGPFSFDGKRRPDRGPIRRLAPLYREARDQASQLQFTLEETSWLKCDY